MNQRTWLIKILAPILFSAPDVHLRLLRKTYVDGMLKLAVWDTSMKKMNEEWQEFILFVSSFFRLEFIHFLNRGHRPLCCLMPMLRSWLYKASIQMSLSTRASPPKLPATFQQSLVLEASFWGCCLSDSIGQNIGKLLLML